MTTESKTGPRTGLPPVLGALAGGTVAVLVLVVAGTLGAGRPGAVGAAVGGVLTLAVFALGLAAVGFVARLLPGASLLVALMTYALQLLVLFVAVAAIDGADLSAGTLSRGWFAVAVIVVTLAWVVGQLVAVTRQRIPVYDLPSDEAAADHPGGER